MVSTRRRSDESNNGEVGSDGSRPRRSARLNVQTPGGDPKPVKAGRKKPERKEKKGASEDSGSKRRTRAERSGVEKLPEEGREEDDTGIDENANGTGHAQVEVVSTKPVAENMDGAGDGADKPPASASSDRLDVAAEVSAEKDRDAGPGRGAGARVKRASSSAGAQVVDGDVDASDDEAPEEITLGQGKSQAKEARMEERFAATQMLPSRKRKRRRASAAEEAPAKDVLRRVKAAELEKSQRKKALAETAQTVKASAKVPNPHPKAVERDGLHVSVLTPASVDDPILAKPAAASFLRNKMRSKGRGRVPQGAQNHFAPLSGRSPLHSAADATGRVAQASVTGGGKTASINKGLCVLLGISTDDTADDADFIVKKLLGLKVFPAAEDGDSGRWTRSVVDCSGQLLVGMKPSFHRSMPPQDAEPLFYDFVSRLRTAYSAESVQECIFGSYMNVSLVNDGPVTLIVDSKQPKGG